MLAAIALAGLYVAYLLLLSFPIAFPAIYPKLPLVWRRRCVDLLGLVGEPFAVAILVGAFFTVSNAVTGFWPTPNHIDIGFYSLMYGIYVYSALSMWPYKAFAVWRPRECLEGATVCSPLLDEGATLAADSSSSEDAGEFEILDREELSDSSSEEALAVRNHSASSGSDSSSGVD